MMKTQLDRANHALQQLIPQVGDAFYPNYHLAPPAGWMNDPNGLIYHNGLYHAFYQHHPYDENWGPMHWGHATSTDMVNWQHQPIALSPGDEWDKDGCFSGCAVDDNGTLTLIYTGHVWLNQPGDDGAIREVQCLATSQDGINFEKQGVILTPPNGIMHFRDPKVWKQDGVWWMVIGARDHVDCGHVLLYRGETLHQWTFQQVLAKADTGEGYMWECPDFFTLGGEQVLMFSPQGIKAEGYRFRNRFQSGYLRGSWRPGTVFHRAQPFVELDLGHDFYAPQSFTAKDGRRIVIGWMDMWESNMPSKAEYWAGCLTLPRELSIKDNGKLWMQPISELETLRRQHVELEKLPLENATRQIVDEASALEIQLQWNLNDSNAERFGLRLGGIEGADEGVSVFIDNQAQRLILNRHYPQHRLSGYRSVEIPAGDTLSFRIFIDKSSIEVFVNNGEASLTSRIYPSEGLRQLSLFADNGQALLASGQYWTLKTG
ncbi:MULTISPECIES: glycoside hydrolase family 32 protein [Yersinia]|uniref:glycoside hydrolase family 32 protein n=1 Tax=Yersinia TaxID=629 RepID=UPI001968A6DF|nr:glycoside hydrolase family 32 protein [Yersinia sp. IP36721]